MRLKNVALVTAIFVGLTGCDVMSSTQRYEMTGVVHTPKGALVRSGVITVMNAHHSSPVTGSYGYSMVRGEAVPFHLGGKRWLIMTVDYPGGAWAALYPWLDAAKPDEKRRAEALGEGAKVQIEGLPMFIYFSNIDDPKTARRVLPGRRDTVLGVGYSVRGVWMQKTDRSETKGIRKVMPWIDRFEKESIQGKGMCGIRDLIPCATRNSFDKKGNV